MYTEYAEKVRWISKVKKVGIHGTVICYISVDQTLTGSEFYRAGAATKETLVSMFLSTTVSK